jgi:sarcosine oxidase
MKHFDVIVAGMGAMGSAALYHLAAAGVRAAGFDRYSPPHSLGSSHGETRMIREAYYENPGYVPLVRRAYDLWHELEARIGETLIDETSGVYAGPADGELVSGMRRAAHEHGIPIESLTHAQAASRFPWIQFEKDWDVVSEPRAGLLYPEVCIATHLNLAAYNGAEIHMGDPVESWDATPEGVVVRTQGGEYHAEKLILTTGAWMIETLSDLGIEAVVERQPLFWFEPHAGASLPATVWALEFEHGKLFYGFPASDAGVKIAIHYGGVQRTTPDEIDRALRDEDVELLRRHGEKYVPELLGPLRQASVCMYTNTPDLHFIFDKHPQHDNVLVISACSGHGFKFSSAIGEAAAQWSRDGESAIDMSLFTLSRFSAK